MKMKAGTKVRYNIQLADDKFIRGTGEVVSVQTAIDGRGDLYRVHSNGVFFRAYDKELEPMDYPDE